jgi:hypothetical protein
MSELIHLTAGFCVGFTIGVKIILNYINNKKSILINEYSQVCPTLVQPLRLLIRQ